MTLALVPEAYKPGDHEPLPYGAFAVRVGDVDEEQARLSAAEVEFVGEPFDSGVCKGAMFTGSTGTACCSTTGMRRSPDGRRRGAARRIDFVAVPVQERAPVEDFYGHMLKLERNPSSTETWVEFETSNVTLAPVQPGRSADLQAASGRDGRVPRPRRRGGEVCSSSRWASSSRRGDRLRRLPHRTVL